MDTAAPRPTWPTIPDQEKLELCMLFIYFVVVSVVVAVGNLVKSCSSPTIQLTKNPGYTHRANQGDSPTGYIAPTSPLFTIYSPHPAPAPSPAPAPASAPAPAPAPSSVPSLVLGAAGSSGYPAGPPPPYSCIYVRPIAEDSVLSLKLIDNFLRIQ